MRRLRRRNHQCAEGWVVYEAYEVKNKGKFLMSFTSPKKEKYIFIYL